MGLAPATLNLWTGQPPNLGLSKRKLFYCLAGLLQGPVYYLPYGADSNNQSIRLLVNGPSFPCSYNQRGNSGTIRLPAYQEGTSVDSIFSMAFSVSHWPRSSLVPARGISGLTEHDITWLLTSKPATADPV